jgi:thimet oligopeptidase
MATGEARIARMHTETEPLLSASPDVVGEACDAALLGARDALVAFKQLPAGAELTEVVDALDAIGHDLNRAVGVASVFFQVHPDPAMRERAAGIEQEVSRFTTELSLDREVFDRLVAVEPAEDADSIAKRILEHALRDFRRAGVDRDEATRDRVRALREELVEIGQEFSKNIASDVRTVVIPEGAAGLVGLPDDWIAGHPAGDDGAVTITTNPTDFLPFMKYAKTRAHREALYRAYMSRGAPANLEVLDRMLARRHELATLLGYAHWADYVTEDKMIKTAQNASDFIGRVTELAGGRMEHEVEELLAFAREEEPDIDQVFDWDRMYLMENLKRRRFEFDSRDVRPFFAYDRMRQGVLDTAARLYGVTFERRDITVWHPDVEVWDLLEGGEQIARFYLDMHPREDKYKHAAMFDMVSGMEGKRVPEASLICNFPQVTDDDPGLMEAGEVTTLFHEFGHLLHHLLAGRQRWLAVSGISTEWDFVEVPSQLFEEWARDAAVLADIAKHHETSEAIPPELVTRMRAAQEYGKGMNIRVQMFYAGLSLEYYSRDPDGMDTTDVARQMKAKYIPFPFIEGTTMQTAFGHLEGYSALYYTYMWSLVLAKDVFSAFGEDLRDADVARRYRECVLAPGGSKDAADLVSDFLGRPFAFDAFETWVAA